MKQGGSVEATKWAKALRVLALAAAAWTTEAGAETYAILSLIGDHLTIVAQRRQTGSHMDVNEYTVVPMAQPAFDDFAARVADAAIAKARPSAGAVTLRAGDPTLYKLRDSWLDADTSGVADLVATVKKQLPPLPDAHLLLIAPYRDEIELRTMYDVRGSGKVSGLGFYGDTATFLRRADTLENARGFLAVFANFQLVLINLQSGAVEGHERVVLGTTYSAARAEDRTVWEALTSAQKAKSLESLIEKGIGNSLPKMLAPPKP